MRLFPIVGIVLALALPSFAQETAAPAEDYGTSAIDEALASPEAPVEATDATAPTEVSEPETIDLDPAAETAAVSTPAAKVVVFLPEQIDAEWYWYYYSDVAQHIVQTALEKELVRAGFEVIDLASVRLLQDLGSIEKVSSPEFATQIAKEAGAQYAIVGKATAVKGSDSVAYGVQVIRSNAEITAKLIRVSDGKILAVEDASAQQGGQAQRAAGQEALKKAAPAFSRKMVKAMQAQLQ